MKKSDSNEERNIWEMKEWRQYAWEGDYQGVKGGQ